MKTDDLILALEQAAARLRQIVTNPPEPVKDGLPLSEAWRALSALPVCSLKLDIFRHSVETKPSVEWTVWDGKKHHESGSLAAAVNAALFFNALQTDADPIETAENAVSPLPF